MVDPGNVKDATGSSAKSMDRKPDMTKRGNAADPTGSEIVPKDAKAKASVSATRATLRDHADGHPVRGRDEARQQETPWATQSRVRNDQWNGGCGRGKVI